MLGFLSCNLLPSSAIFNFKFLSFNSLPTAAFSNCWITFFKHPAYLRDYLLWILLFHYPAYHHDFIFLLSLFPNPALLHGFQILVFFHSISCRPPRFLISHFFFQYPDHFNISKFGFFLTCRDNLRDLKLRFFSLNVLATIAISNFVKAL